MAEATPPRAPWDLALLAERASYDRLPGWRREPPEWDTVERPDILVWSGPLPHRDLSRVCYARWTEATAEFGITEVLAFFADRNVTSFEWDVGPSSRPADLASRLANRGLVPVGRARLMTRDLTQLGPAIPSIVEVRAVLDEQTARHYFEVARPDWSPDRVSPALRERIAYTAETHGGAGYLVAYLHGEPVGTASWRDSTDDLAVYLTGATTRPEFRRRGIYTTLFHHRAHAALRRGRRYAAITAIAGTSAPILQRLDFADHGELVTYGPRTRESVAI